MRVARALIVLASAAGLQQLPSQTPASKARAAPLAPDGLGQESPRQALDGLRWHPSLRELSSQAPEAQAPEAQAPASEPPSQAPEAQAPEAQAPASESPSQALSQTPELQEEELWVPCARGRCLDANFIFIRIFKTGSSSFASVLHRIGEYHGVNGIHKQTVKQLINVPEPLVSTDHYERKTFHKQEFVQKLGEFSKRNIFVTIVREPVAREMSAYYYRKSVSKFHGTELDFLKQLDSNFMLNFLSPKSAENAEPAQISADYDFIAVTERFDESLVALMSTLGLKSYCELLFTKAKSSASGTDKWGKPWKPHKTLEQQSPEVLQYIDSPEFQNKIAKDKELYHLANERLNNTIAKIGRPLFDRRLQEFVHLKDTSQAECDADGMSEFDDKNCYVSDLGCDYKCLDDFCRKHQADMTPTDAP